MAQQTAEVDSAQVKAETLQSVLQAQANEYGEVPDAAEVTITVSYENRNGNISLKHGDVWRATDDRIQFSQNVGETDEDPYFIRFDYSGATLVSVSDRGHKTDLGDVSNVVIED